MTAGRDRRDDENDVPTASLESAMDTSGDAAAPDRAELRRRLDAAMERLAVGDRTQFSIVFAELWPVLSRTCIRWLGDADEGEDAAQRALITLMGRAHEYRAGASTLSWALTLAMWECRTVRRRRQRSRVDPIDRAAELAASDPSPELSAMNREATALARAVFEKLSPAEQLLVQGALVAEAGASPAVPAIVRKRKQRALDRLRDLWRRRHGD
jgi:RNA polymerase sigma-70 factor (ECF subfamily)